MRVKQQIAAAYVGTMLGISISLPPAEAQIGASLRELTTAFEHEEAGQTTGSLEDIVKLSDRRSLSVRKLTHRGNRQLAFYAYFVDDRCVAICPQKHKRPDLAAVRLLLGSASIANPAGQFERTEWYVDAEFSAVYPPIGNSSSNMSLMPVKRTFGQKRTLHFRDGVLVGASPWENLSVPTGRVIQWFHQYNYALNKTVMISPDGRLFAVLVTRQSVSGNNLGGLRTLSSSSEIEKFFVCEPDAFWNYTSAGIQAETYGKKDDYDSLFPRLIPEANRAQFNVERMAIALVCMVDRSSMPIERLQEEAAHLSDQWNAELSTRFENQLLRQLPTRTLDEKRRRLAALGKVGTLASTDRLVRLLSKKPTKEGTYAALREIAERHRLPPPPEIDASAATWRTWQRSIGRDE